MLMLRTTHDALLASKDAEIAALREDLRREQDRHDATRAAHDAFVAEVGTRTMPAPVVQLAPKREPDAADTAIDFVAQGDSVRRRYLERYAKAQRRAGMDADAIATAILHGDRGEGDDEGTT